MTEKINPSPPSALTPLALRELEARQKLFVEKLPAVVWTTDLQLRFTSSMGAGLADLGLVPNEVVGLNFYEFFETDDPACPPIEAQRRTLNGESVNLTWEWRGRVFQTHFEPLHDDAGNIVGGMGIALDITEKNRLQTELWHMQKMESIGRTASTIASDFNTLLRVQKGCLKAMSETAGEHPELRRLITEMEAVNVKAESLAARILDYSRKLPPHRVSFNPGDLLRDMTDNLRRVVNNQVEMVFSIDDPIPEVYADRSMIEQVILNLAINADEAMPEGGELRFAVSTRQVRRSECLHATRQEQLFVSISLADTGRGMNRAVRDRAFEPFFTTKTDTSGAGLGLSSAYEAVRQHGGWIDVVSTPGLGSTFTVYLPAV